MFTAGHSTSNFNGLKLSEATLLLFSDKNVFLFLFSVISTLVSSKWIQYKYKEQLIQDFIKFYEQNSKTWHIFATSDIESLEMFVTTLQISMMVCS